MIKKLILTLCFGFALTAGNAQVFEKGKVIVDVYYGAPNWFTFLNRLEYAGEGSTTRMSGIGPVGVRGEFMVTDLIGVGVDVGIIRSKAERQFNLYNTTTNEQEYTIHTSTTQKIGAIATFNFHPLKNDVVDLAVVAGIGYGKRTYGSEYDPGFAYAFENPILNYYNYNFFQSSDSFLGSGTVSVPVSFRIGIIMRFFISDNFGLHFGVGAVHGGIINGGLSLKF